MDDLRDVIEEVKVRNDIADVISNYIQLKPSGSNYKGLCPFHGEKTPSFHVNTSKQIFKCFGCGEGGDVISFIMKIENLDFIDSVKFLASKSGIVINDSIDEKTKIKLEKTKKFQEINIEAARFFYLNLMDKKNIGYEYLIKRGLDEKTIKNFGLGYSHDSWDSLKKYLLSKNYTIDELFECGLISQNKSKTDYYDKFRNRVMFPIFDYKGVVIGFGGRVLDDGLPKYLNSPDSEIFNKRYNLYGLNFSRKHIGNQKTLILVEGYMDLISLYQFGIKNVVATLGTALTDEQAILIKKYADKIILSYDSDSAGVAATLRAIDILERQGLDARVLSLKDSKDPDEFIRQYGISEFFNCIDIASDSTKFKIDTEATKYDLSNRKEIVDFLKGVIVIIKSLKSPLELDYYIKYLSELTNTNSEIIRSEIFGGVNTKKQNFNKKTYGNRDVVEKKVNVKKYIDIRDDDENNLIVETNLLKAMLLSKKAREIVQLKIAVDDFDDENSRKIFSKVSGYDKEGIIPIKDVSLIIDNIGFIKRLDKVDLSSIDLDDVVEIEKIINLFLKKKINKKISKLSEKQKILENRRKTMANDSKEAKEVDLEIMKIALEIISENKKEKLF